MTIVEREEYYKDNREIILERSKQYQIDNKEKIKAYCIKNKEKILQYNRDNKEYIQARAVQYRLDNKEHISQYNKNNKEKMTNYLKMPITCQCGAIVSRRNFSTHNKSIKHL